MSYQGQQSSPLNKSPEVVDLTVSDDDDDETDFEECDTEDDQEDLFEQKQEEQLELSPPNPKRTKVLLSVPENQSLSGAEFFMVTSEGETFELTRASPTTVQLDNVASSAPPPEKSNPPRTLLGSICKHVLEELKAQHPEEMKGVAWNNLESSPQFQNMMQEWKMWKTNHSDPWKAANPNNINITHKDKLVGVKWENGRLFAKIKPDNKFAWSRAATKCTSVDCWNVVQGHANNPTYACDEHSLLNRQTLIVRDIMNTNEVVLLVLWPRIGVIRTNNNINEFIKSQARSKNPRKEKSRRSRLADYLARKPDALFVIEQEWRDSKDKSEERYHTVSLTLSQLVLLHNSIPDRQFDIELLNKWIHTLKANLEMNRLHLELNKNVFSSGAARPTNQTVSKLKPVNFNNQRPYVYFAHKPPSDGTVCILYRFRATPGSSKTKASSSHSVLKKTALTVDGVTIDDNSIYEFFQTTAGSFEEFETEAREVEMIGHVIVQVENMLDMNFQGIPIRSGVQKYEHYDDTWDDIANYAFQWNTQHLLQIVKTPIGLEKKVVRVEVNKKKVDKKYKKLAIQWHPAT